MKKILLAVNYDYHDYGGMLQAFATQQALSKMDIASEVINFDAMKKDINQRKWKYFLRNITDFSIVKEKSRLLGKRLRSKLNGSLKNNQSKRDAAFDTFCQASFNVSRKFENWDDLSRACSKYDAVLVGSDQLWLPSNVAGDYYTLNFVPDNVRKIAYATSFGIGTLPKDMKVQYASFLNRIECLSAREYSGQDIIRRCTGRDVQLVCDPTLLLTSSDWEKVLSSKSVPKEKYIFCYFMGDNPNQRDFVKRLAQKEGLKIVGLLHLDQYIPSDEKYVDYAPFKVSPADFVGLVKNATYICTDSFHGTVFSIIFSRDFFTFRRFRQKASLSTNTRLESLLMKLNLEDRLFDGSEEFEKLHITNYDEIQKRVENFRETSKEYLIKSLN